MSRALSLVAFVAVAACGGATAVQPPPPPAPAPQAVQPALAPPAPVDPDHVPMPLWGEVHKGVLPNGLTYYILKHGKPEKRAMLWLAVNAGSVQEDEDQRGLAHFDEHMAFNGTKRFPKSAIVDYLEKIGMRFGADLNAYTTWDQTVYQLEVPTDNADFMSKGLDILRDWAGDVSYDPVEVDKERGVVLEEWRLGRGANARLFDKQAKVLFKGSRYADRITIGDPEIIKHAKRDTLYRFYKDWYRPDLLAVIAVGDFDPAEMQKQIEARFGDLRAPASERQRPAGGVPPATGTRISIETDREAPATSITVANLTPHHKLASKADFRRALSQELYNAILNERLATLARRPDAPYSAAFGLLQSVVRDVDAFERFAEVKSGHVEDALRALFTEVLRIERHGITTTELERARERLIRGIAEAATREATTDSREFTDELTRNFFESELVIGREAESALTKDILPKVTIDELDALVKEFAGPDSRAIMISAPDGTALPTEARVREIVDEVQRSEIAPWEDKAPQHALMAAQPAAGKIVREKKIDSIGVTEWTLSNGVRVVVKPTDYELDSVVIEGESPGGEAMARDKDFDAARYADEIVDASGVGDFDADTLGKVLSGKQVQIETRVGESTEGVEAKGSVTDLETLFQLTYLRMTAPHRDPQAFAVWKQNALESLTNELRTPEVAFAREAVKAEWRSDRRHTPATPEQIDKIDLDRALAFYRDRYGDASDFTFVIVGAVEPDKLKPLVETYLASLPAKGRRETEKDLGARKVGGVVKKEWKLGQEPKAAVMIDFHADDAWSRDKDRDMFILGQVLSIKLREVMREDLGGVYGVYAGGSYARAPHQARSFQLHFGCDPKRVDELISAAFIEIRKLAKDGAGDDYLEKVKQTFLRNRETQMRDNSFWASWLVTSYRFGDDPTLILDPSKLVARITSDHVRDSAKRYLDAKQFYQAVLLPAQ